VSHAFVKHILDFAKRVALNGGRVISQRVKLVQNQDLTKPKRGTVVAVPEIREHNVRKVVVS